MVNCSFISKRIVLAVCLGMLILACSMPEPPTITPDSAQVTAVTPRGITVKIALNVHNPNGFALKARRVRAHVVLDGTVKLGPIDVRRGVKLPAKRTKKITVDIEAPWESAAQVASLAAGSPKIPYVVKARVVIGGKKLNTEVPVTIKGEVTQAQLLKAGLKGLPKIPGLPSLPDLSIK